jgi:predicted dienelactone hydrolase
MLLLLTLACTEPAAEAPPPWAPPDGPGPWPAGVTTLTFEDPRGRILTAEVWYPGVAAANDAPDAYDPIPVTLNGWRNVPAADVGPRPLVAFSHGFGGIRYQSASLMEHLASHGYVVVAPDHDGTILLYIDWDDLDRHLLERPDDIRFSVDEVLRRSADGDPILGGLVTEPRYAMIGHSFGAVTALVVTGAEPDFAAAAAACAEVDRDGCDYIPAIDPEDLVGHGFVDARAEALVAMSPGGWYAFGADGAHLATTPPSLVLAGDRDGVLDYVEEQRPTFERLGAPSTLVTFPNAGHYAAFSDMCLLLPTFEDCVGEAEGFLPAAVGQPATNAAVTAWLGNQWLGDDRAAPYLADAVLTAGLTLETR